MAASILYSLAVFFVILALYDYLGFRSQKRQWKQRMERQHGEAEKRKSIIVVWGDRFDQSKLALPMKQKLQRANIPLAPSEFYGMLIVGGLAIAVLSSTMFNISFPINIIFAIGGIIGTYWVLFLIRRNKYMERLNGQLSEVCRLLGNSARAGMTIAQGIDLVAKEVPAPAGEEFQKLSRELKLGVDFERALRKLQERVPSRDFQLFVATLLIQKKEGGNLSVVLEEMANTLEERKVVQQAIKTMTAEERFTSYLVPAMPVFLLLMMNQIMDDFLAPLASIPGMILGGLFVAGTIVSFILIRRVTNIRV